MSFIQLPDVQTPREIFLKSEKGEIDVFICPKDMIGSVDSPALLAGDPLLENFDPIMSPFQRVTKTSSPRSKHTLFRYNQYTKFVSN